MEPLSYKAIAQALGASYTGAGETSHICTDSREVTPGCVFVALEGDNFDGHDYAVKALDAGAEIAVVSKAIDAPKERTIHAADTRMALLEIARLYRSGLGVRVVGITGSVGKTTTKEMTACVIESGFKTLKTEENLNNEVGLSATIFRLSAGHRAAVLEIAMDGPGQIAPMSRAAMPDVAIVTKIGVTHMEKMGSQEAIREEKLSIRAGMPDGGILILNGDDPLLRGFTDSRLTVLFYGLENEESAVFGSGIKEGSTGTDFQIRYNGERFVAWIPTIGRHNVTNALAAFTAGISMGVTPDAIIKAIKDYTPAGMRQRIVEHNGATIVEDCYNASPDSMAAALKTLGAMDTHGRKIAVLSDMLELGERADCFHFDMGAIAGGCGIDMLLCTGDLATGYVEGARKCGIEQAIHFASKDELADFLRKNFASGDTAWFKASRGMKLESVLEKLYEK